MKRFFKKGINWRYALGEVMLIFIGITLAMAFNNWNEENQQRALEKQSLTRLLEDLQQDEERLIFLDTSYVRLISDNRKAIQLFTKADDAEDMREVVSIPYWLSRYLSTQTSTFEEMVHSGVLYTIQDRSLLNAITSHYKTIEKYDDYTRQNYLTVPGKWDHPAFASFGIASLQPLNETIDDFVDFSWVGQPNHSTYQAVRFALEQNLYVLRQNQIIVQEVYKRTLDLISQLETVLGE